MDNNIKKDDPKGDYAASNESRRYFLKALVIAGTGGIMLGRKAFANGLERVVEEGAGLRKVTANTSSEYQGCLPNCEINRFKEESSYSTQCSPDACRIISPVDTPCLPNCTPKPCTPNCSPTCSPEPCSPECSPHCNPECSPCVPHQCHP